MATLICSITEEECNCGIEEFYINAAKGAKLLVTKDCRFDCRKIHVTKQVQDILINYYVSSLSKTTYSDEHGARAAAVKILLMYGPKADLDSQSELGDGLWVKFDDGFIVYPEIDDESHLVFTIKLAAKDIYESAESFVCNEESLADVNISIDILIGETGITIPRTIKVSKYHYAHQGGNDETFFIKAIRAAAIDIYENAKSIVGSEYLLSYISISINVLTGIAPSIDINKSYFARGYIENSGVG